MNTVIQVTAPGRVILHGEHAVVYGKSAIAASINLRSKLELVQNQDGRVNVDLPAVGITRSWTVQEIAEHFTFPLGITADTNDIPQGLIKSIKQLIDANGNLKQELALTNFLFLYTAIAGSSGNLPAISVKIQSDIPIGAGLSSSASLSVCLVTALLLQQGLITDPNKDSSEQCWLEEDLELINKWAFQGEKIMHGRPSGIDNSMATYGGAIQFQGGKITKLKKMPSLRILITNTKVPRSTKVLVAGVREKFNKHEDIVQPVLDSIEAISERSLATLSSLMSGDDSESYYKTMEELIDFNQHLLQTLGVSHTSIDRICEITAKHNFHTKLTGAGGGGCCITLLRPDTAPAIIEKLKSELQDGHSFSCWETNICGPGVQVCYTNKPVN